MENASQSRQQVACPLSPRASVLVVAGSAAIAVCGLLVVEALCRFALPLVKGEGASAQLTGTGSVAVVAVILAIQSLFGYYVLRGHRWAQNAFFGCAGANLVFAAVLWVSGLSIGRGLLTVEIVALWLFLSEIREYRDYARDRRGKAS